MSSDTYYSKNYTFVRTTKLLHCNMTESFSKYFVIMLTFGHDYGSLRHIAVSFVVHLLHKECQSHVMLFRFPSDLYIVNNSFRMLKKRLLRGNSIRKYEYKDRKVFLRFHLEMKTNLYFSSF